MKRLFSSWRAVLASVTMLAVTSIVLFRYTDFCQLEAVTLNGEPIENWQANYGLSSGAHIFDQPLDSLAREILKQKNVLKVDLSFALPGTIRIQTNDFAAVCFVIDNSTGAIRGLNAQSRVVELKGEHDDWEHPVLTGIAQAAVHNYASDARVPRVVGQLMKLRDKQTDLYRLIDEINFSHSGYLSVSISGLSFQLYLRSGQLVGRLTSFIRFLEQFDRNTEFARAYDLRFENMIIEVKKKI